MMPNALARDLAIEQVWFVCMAIEIITKEDLENFRVALLKDIEKLLNNRPSKKWLKSGEVMEMLDISEVKLQTLRDKKIIPFKKLGGTCYYNIEDIDKTMENL